MCERKRALAEVVADSCVSVALKPWTTSREAHERLKQVSESNPAAIDRALASLMSKVRLLEQYRTTPERKAK